MGVHPEQDAQVSGRQRPQLRHCLRSVPLVLTAVGAWHDRHRATGIGHGVPIKKSAMAVGHRHAAGAATAHQLSLVRQQLTRLDDFGFRFLTSALDCFRTREPSNVVIPFF